jgi:hypothetical protein
VVSTRQFVSVDRRRAAKLTCPHDEGFMEQPAIVQILKYRANRSCPRKTPSAGRTSGRGIRRAVPQIVPQIHDPPTKAIEPLLAGRQSFLEDTGELPRIAASAEGFTATQLSRFSASSEIKSSKSDGRVGGIGTTWWASLNLRFSCGTPVP